MELICDKRKEKVRLIWIQHIQISRCMQLINNLKNEIVRRLKTILLVFAVLSLSSCDKSESLDATT